MPVGQNDLLLQMVQDGFAALTERIAGIEAQLSHLTKWTEEFDARTGRVRRSPNTIVESVAW